VALNPDTVELVWYFQHTQNDQWDMDWVFKRIIVELPSPDSGTVKAVLNVGKNVMLDALDAVTGHYALLMLIEKNGLMGRGLGFIDVHLLAATLLANGSRVWSRDKRLQNIADELHLSYTPISIC